jgi:hypothetical protein
MCHRNPTATSLILSLRSPFINYRYNPGLPSIQKGTGAHTPYESIISSPLFKGLAGRDISPFKLAA